MFWHSNHCSLIIQNINSPHLPPENHAEDNFEGPYSGSPEQSEYTDYSSDDPNPDINYTSYLWSSCFGLL